MAKIQARLCFLLTVTIVSVYGESTPEILRDPSFLQLLNKHYSTIQTPKINLGYGAEPNYRYTAKDETFAYTGSAYDGSGYDSHYGTRVNSRPTTSDTNYYYQQQTQTEKTTSPDQQVPVSSQEYWNPTNALTTPWNASGSEFGEGYGKASVVDPASSYVKSNSHYGADPMQGSYSAYQYQYVRPGPAPTPNFVTIKKPQAYYGKGKIVRIPEPSAKPTVVKYKKVPAPLSYHANSGAYKKTAYPKIHSPYVVHKHPGKKTAVPLVLHPYYKKYYPYYNPQYLIPSKTKKPFGYPDGYYYKHSDLGATAAPDTKIPSSTEKYPTTERMDGTYLEKPIQYDDYTNYNDTYYKSNRINNYTTYYETYEEPEESSSERDDQGYEQEVTTRGYYGDRIYMSTQGPEKNANNRLYFVRSEARGDDDQDSIFD